MRAVSIDVLGINLHYSAPGHGLALILGSIEIQLHFNFFFFSAWVVFCHLPSAGMGSGVVNNRSFLETKFVRIAFIFGEIARWMLKYTEPPSLHHQRIFYTPSCLN